VVASKFNSEVKGQGKLELIAHVESYLEKPISSTQKWEEKFNVFKINLKGGW
jgi:hypothetical protein